MMMVCVDHHGRVRPAASSSANPNHPHIHPYEQGIRDWTPAVLDVAARAAMPDARETAALLALLRRRWSPPPPSTLPLPLPIPADKADDNESGNGSGSDEHEGAQRQQGAQSLLELTAAVYRRGGARGPGETSRLPALVALFVALQEQEGVNVQEEREEQPPRFLGANDGVAYLQVGWKAGRHGLFIYRHTCLFRPSVSPTMTPG